MLVGLGSMAYSQAGYQVFYNDTINGDTVTNTSGVNVAYDGFVTWEVTVDGKSAEDSVYVEFQGSNNNWTTIWHLDTTTFVGTTATNYMFTDNPAKYLRYRTYMRADSIADTTYFSNQLLIYKRK